MKEKDERFNNRLLKGISALATCLDSPGIIDPVDADDVLKDLEQVRGEAKGRSKGLLYSIGIVNGELKRNIETFIHGCDSFREDVVAHNQELLAGMAEDVGRTINPVEGRDLDQQQLSAIAYDIRSRLVIAGAGTGKTTTIIGLVKHLLTTGAAQPEEILLLSFTNASVKELNQRIISETGRRIDTKTFHRLGMNIIASADGKVPKVTTIDLNRFIREELDRRKADPRYMRDLNRYLAYDHGTQKKESDFRNRSEYMRYLEENPLITFNGERVKSFGEADIANFLSINGIPYQYEASYPVDTNDSQYGQYHPDFHITGTDIYIEYFGTDREGNVAPFMIDENPNASEEYRQGIEWKRSIHSENRTRLIELYSYHRFEGELQSVLESELRRHGVMPDPEHPLSTPCCKSGCDDGRTASLVSMFTTVILLIKGRGGRWEEAFPRGDSIMERRRLERLERVLKPLFDAYQRKLEENGEIDFEDMLNLASYCVDNGGYHHPYRYVIVDEYQDLSFSRYNLLRSLRESGDYRLFCVGDDWQSIYRFNGCDISFILDFKRYWGPSAICRIETTYRFNGDLLRMSSAFIQRNGRQYRKNLVGVGDFNCRVEPICVQSPEDARRALARTVSLIPEGDSVLFLGRYNHDVRVLNGNGFSWTADVSDRSSLKVSYAGRPDLHMRFMTIHGSKGLQANHVISLNNVSGPDGFPGSREESPVVSMLLGGEDDRSDEERRLFYVAMTRANRTFHILSYEGRQSEFYRELFGGSSPSRKSIGSCPVCGGLLVLREGRYGRFYGCSNFHSRGCRFKRKVDERF